MPDVTCFGVAVADIIAHPVDAWPTPGRLVPVQSIQLRSGGPAFTAGVALARLGVATAVVARVGADPFGEYLRAVLRDHGVAAHLRLDEGAPTSATVVAVAADGERSFLHAPGANARLAPEDFPPSLLGQTQILHLGGYFLLPALDGEPAAGLLRQARAAGCRTSMDTAWDAQGRWMHTLAPCLPHLDLLFGNHDEMAMVTGEREPARIAAALRASGPRVVAVKMGADGAYVAGPAWHGRCPAFAVPVVDTTGAGDVFCAGFLAAQLAGWDLERSTRFANAVGALCVTAVGGATGLRTMAETVEFMEHAAVRS